MSVRVCVRVSLSFSIFISALPLHHHSPRWPTPPSAGERANRLLPSSPCEKLETYLFSHYLHIHNIRVYGKRNSEILVYINTASYQAPLQSVIIVELVGFHFKDIFVSRVCYSLQGRKHALCVCSNQSRPVRIQTTHLKSGPDVGEAIMTLTKRQANK